MRLRPAIQAILSQSLSLGVKVQCILITNIGDVNTFFCNGEEWVVLNCKTGCKNSTERISLFQISRNQVKEWSKVIPCKDTKLTSKDHVCVKHLSENEIIKELKSDPYTVNAYCLMIMVQISRDRYRNRILIIF